MTPHTPEPWIAKGDVILMSDELSSIGEMHAYYNVSGADAQRAVTCVNACAGMANPEAEIRKMREIAAMAAAHQCLDIDDQNLAECRVRGANPDFYCLSCLAKHTLKNV